MKEKLEHDRKILKIAYNALDGKFGMDIKILDIQALSIMADYFIIASGNNSNQLRSMADELETKLFEVGVALKHSEGFQSANWILLDFGDVIAHIFDQESRMFYDLEHIWADAPMIEVESL